MPRPTSKLNQQQRAETVEGAWLLRAVAFVIAIALVCTYLTLCFLFYRGQWQMVLHPIRTPTADFSQVVLRFGPGDTGQPQLVGDWLPALPGGPYGNLTVLFLSSGDGNRSSFAATHAALQQLGLNVFAFDYRGYGQSANLHPSQQSMIEDSNAAWSYLTETRGVPGAAILPYGVGAGASLAAHLLISHPEIPGVILDSPHTDLHELIGRDPRLRLLPTGLLFKEDFPLAAPLSSLQRPKLLISTGRGAEAASFLSAAAPKIMISLDTRSGP
ncbi:MAG TPA: alpha/beta hydrolase, partial [Edaphobacter sp.]|nr:alpha/beta hydrolase [Edaphobacter sp.]